VAYNVRDGDGTDWELGLTAFQNPECLIHAMTDVLTDHAAETSKYRLIIKFN